MTDRELWQMVWSALVIFFVTLGNMLEAVPWRWVFLFLGINSILSYLKSINKALEALHGLMYETRNSAKKIADLDQAREYRELRD